MRPIVGKSSSMMPAGLLPSLLWGQLLADVEPPSPVWDKDGHP